MLQNRANNPVPVTHIKCDRRCVQQENAPCEDPNQTKSENSSRTSEKDTESLHSGESIFKTFTFQAPDNDPDMKKCRTFWNAILDKNLKPVKCTLQSPKEKKTKVKKQTDKRTCEEKTKEMLLDVYKDLQRRKLDKLKLTKTKPCNPCDDYIDEVFEKTQEMEDIKNLNSWHSQPTDGERPSRIDIKSQVKKTLQALQSARSFAESKEPTKDKGSRESQRKIQKKRSSSYNKMTKTSVTVESKVEVMQDSKGNILDEEPKTEDIEIAKDDHEEIFCCKCGCGTEECICCELEELKIPQDTRKTCPCGCKFEECICEVVDKCGCGCGMKECVCSEAVEMANTCFCGCGQQECVCQELITNTCGCGNPDCDCTLVGLLNQYLDTIELKNPNTPFYNNTKSCQTEEEKWLEEATKKQGTYCIICGHFNCFCNEEITK